jgi:chemotaxis protein methyltransferase CheR
VGLDLAAYRAAHVEERVRRAIDREGLDDTAALARLLKANEPARGRFVRSVAVSYSGLFRDPEQFDALGREVLPKLLENARTINVWSAGCADGSELYSVALMLERGGAAERATFLGSDLLSENVELAERATYDGNAMPPHLRRRTRWEQRDLVRDGPPPGSWHIVLCRNVAIYLAPAAKADLYAMLAGALAPTGVLMIGRSERIAEPLAIGLERTGPHLYRRCA